MKAVNSRLEKLALKKTLGKGLEFGLDKLIRKYSPASIYAHELGHAKTLMGSSPRVRKLRMAAYGYGGGLGALASTAPALMGKPGTAAVTRAAFEAPRLIEEMLATKHGLKALKGLKFISPKAYKRARRDLVAAFLTYGANAAGGTARAAIIASAVKRAGGLGNLMGSGKGLTSLKARYAIGQVAPMGVQLAARGVLVGGAKKTPVLSRAQRIAVRKAMGIGKDLKNLQLKGQGPLDSFFLSPVSKENQKKYYEALSGKAKDRRILKKVLAEGGISVPKKSRGEINLDPADVGNMIRAWARELQRG